MVDRTALACEGSNHPLGTEGHDDGPAMFSVTNMCRACGWGRVATLCAGRVRAVRSSDCQMTCPECSYRDHWGRFWAVIDGIPAAGHEAGDSPRTDTEAGTDPAVSLIDSFEQYLVSRRRAPGTIRQRVRHIRLLEREYPDLSSVTPVSLDAWVRAQAQGKKPATVNTLIKSLRVFYAWACRFSLIADDPASLLDQLPNPHRMGRTVTDLAIQRALASASPHERAMILLGRLAGLRLSELTALHTSAREGDWLTIVGKGSKERRIFVAPQLSAALSAVEPVGGGYFFPSRFGDGHMHPQSVCKIIRRVTGVNPHALRHAAGTAVYSATKDLRATQEFLGHSTPNTTSIYVHVGADTLRSATLAGALEASG